MKEAISMLPFFTRITITYIVYPKDKRVFDIGNVCSVTDKFFLDALVDNGKIEDDSYEFVPEIKFKYGHIDKYNPRVEILIKEIRDKNMITTAIKLQEEDIKEAITAHLLTNGYVPEGKEINIELESDQGEIVASVELTDPKRKVTRKRSTIKKTVNKPTESKSVEEYEELTDDGAIQELTDTDGGYASTIEGDDTGEVSEEDGLFD